LLLLCLLAQCRLDGTPAPREETFVTVRLHDSLKRYDSVEIVLLAGGDSNQVVGKVWAGPLSDPSAVPPFRLPDGEERPLTVRVRGFDSAGRMSLNMSISKTGGTQVVADLPLPGPATGGNPGDTSKPPVVPPDTTKPPVVPPDTAKPDPDPDDPSRLASLSVSPGSLSPGWDTARFAYRIDLAYAESTLALTAVPVSNRTVVLAGRDTLPNGKASSPMKFPVGENTLTVRSVNKKHETDYTLKVVRADAPPDTGNPAFPPRFRSWKQRGSVVVNLKSLGMDRAWSESGIPLLLRLTRDNFDFTQAAGDGRDVRFARQDGTPLPFEISRWEASQKRAEIWFHPDLLRATDDTVRYWMYWGNSKATSLSAGDSVFPSVEGHGAVFHLSEQGAGQADEYRNSVGRLHGQGGGGDTKHVPARVEGVVGYAQDFHPTADGINVPVLGNILGQTYQAAIGLPKELDPGSQTWTFQAWVRRQGYQTDAILFQKSDAWSAADQRFVLRVYKDNSQLSVSREGAEGVSNTYIPGQQFIHLGLVYTGGKFDIYVDGFMRESVNWTQGGDPLARCVLGAAYADGRSEGFDGLIDEVWIAGVPRSPMWMRMTFESQRQGSRLVTLER
jgi:hypothetical protein